ncbi:ankyrin-3 [Caerostris extrusa]|uniref:Ankyrin-3 n=1 Tax=Caerostris extrusa TaxID=172846 RepID=A0AAV4NRV0_CAEEX|nr:ankyrin-3 [Caerostris extrusa]
MLRLWLQKSGSKATGNELEKGLRKINREDIIKNCMFNVELVTDDVEKAVAKVHLDQSGFDVFKEELGSSREASMRRGASLDISYDEQDIMKEAESAAETSSETGSLFERDQISQALTDDKELTCQKDEPSKCIPESDVSALFPKCKRPSNPQNEDISPDNCITHNSNLQTSDSNSNEINPLSSFDISESNIKVMNNEVEKDHLSDFQNGIKLHEFWPPDKILVNQPNDIKPTSPTEFNDSMNNEKNNAKNTNDLIETNENNFNIHSVIISENDNKTPFTDTILHKVECDKSIDVHDLGYCSMDKDANTSLSCSSDNPQNINVPLIADNFQQAKSEPQIVTSSDLKQNAVIEDLLLKEQTPDIILLKNENYETNQQTNISADDQIKNECLEKELSDQTSQNFIDSNVTICTPESTKVTTVISSGMDVICTPADAKIRRASKTPPPSPVDESGREDDNVDKVKEILLTQSALQDKLKEEKVPAETEQKLLETSGHQEIPARLTESETWPSLELDTSQVSIPVFLKMRSLSPLLLRFQMQLP